MKKDFKLFQKCFEHYRRLFGLTGYKCYFKHEKVDGAFADISIDENNRVVTVRLDNDCDPANKPFYNPMRSAKHEALHLLIWKLSFLASERFIRAKEIDEEGESLVFKLEALIPDIKS